MSLQIAALITSFIIAFLMLPVIIKYSLKKKLLDIPGRRKIHKKVTPSMGGIAIFCAFFISIIVWLDIESIGHIRFILVSLFVVFFIGVRDDLVPLRPYLKLLGQIISAFLVVLLFDLRIDSFYGLFGIYDLPNWFSYVLTIFTMIVITNSYNLIDGLDGLAGTLAGISLLCLGIWFFLVGDSVFGVLSFAMLGSIFAFLFFNWEPSEVFMGDTGALVIGIFLSVLIIHFINSSFLLADGDTYKFNAPIATGACFILIPLVDTLRIVILRLLKGQPPFRPDKSHVHHAIMRLGKTHSQTTIILGVTQLTFIILAVLLKGLSDIYMLVGVILSSIVLSVILDRMILKKLDVKEVPD